MSLFTHPLVQCLAVSTQLALIRVPAQNIFVANLGPNMKLNGFMTGCLVSRPTCHGISPGAAAVRNVMYDPFLLFIPHFPQTRKWERLWCHRKWHRKIVMCFTPICRRSVCWGRCNHPKCKWKETLQQNCSGPSVDNDTPLPPPLPSCGVVRVGETFEKSAAEKLVK